MSQKPHQKLENPEHTFVINVRKVHFFLTGVVAFLVFMGLVTQTIKYVTGHERLWGITVLFDLGHENNIPSFFSGVLLFLSGLMLLSIAALTSKGRGTYRTHWLCLAALFIFMAFDEACSLHELAKHPLNAMGIGAWSNEVFGYGWVVIGFTMVIAVVLMFLKFWLRLPRRTRALFFLAAVVFIGGAIGVEIIGGRYIAVADPFNLTYNLMVAVEEFMEMIGIVIFIYAILNYISQKFVIAHVRIV